MTSGLCMQPSCALTQLALHRMLENCWSGHLYLASPPKYHFRSVPPVTEIIRSTPGIKLKVTHRSFSQDVRWLQLDNRLHISASWEGNKLVTHSVKIKYEDDSPTKLTTTSNQENYDVLLIIFSEVYVDLNIFSEVSPFQFH